jgi:2-(3-amino-3-carboxypropyl)histidine synthase
MIKEHLESLGIKVSLQKGKHAAYKGQLLGCSIGKIKAKAFLYVGDGLFHPKALAIFNDKPVYTYNPMSKKISKITESMTRRLRQKMKAGLAKFHASKKIGILISTKDGQLSDINLKKKYKDKEFYSLVSDTIDFTQLENFPFIECFVNTACPRIAYDTSLPRPVVDLPLLL